MRDNTDRRKRSAVSQRRARKHVQLKRVSQQPSRCVALVHWPCLDISQSTSTLTSLLFPIRGQTDVKSD